MSEIEKLYENAGIYPDCRARECGLDYCANSSGCGYAVYPDFTAEKQLDLLKICFDKYERLEKVRGLKERCIIYYRFDKNGYTEFVNCETWEETIAGLINNLWSILTEEECKQIKEILE